MVTHLPQNQFITNPAMPTTGSAVAFSDPSGSAATAAPIPCSACGLSHNAVTQAVEVRPPHEPTSSTGGPQRAPAGHAPNTAAPAGAHWEGPWWLVLAEVLEFPPIELTDEVPLFIRDGDHLRRWEA